MGEPPSHPELLDHLADRFVRDGWSVKRLIRAIVLSQHVPDVEQRADARADAGRPAEPAAPPHAAPAARGRGDPRRDPRRLRPARPRPCCGPVVEVHLTDVHGRPRPARSEGGPLDGDGRRSLYTKVRRNFLPPMMLAFDMPIPFSTIGRRSVSNVPAQALILMNDPFVVEQAKRVGRGASCASRG